MKISAIIRPAAPLLVLAGLSMPVSANVPAQASVAAEASHSETVETATRLATIEPARGDFINAGTVYAFSRNALYRVYTAPERVTDIALQPGENLISVASGDTVRWIIGDTTSGSGTEQRVHVLVKPVAAGLSTNLVITTDRRAYHLALTSSPGPAMAALSWNYPLDALLALRRSQSAARAAQPVAAGIEIEKLDFAYAISGDKPAWRPLRAFDDGRQTFIEFPRSIAVGEAPPLFLSDREGEVSLVNYRLEGRFYIVDRLFETAELRLGKNKQDVVRIARVAEGKRSPRSGS